MSGERLYVRHPGLDVLDNRKKVFQARQFNDHLHGGSQVR
jgi:hypothetical protein